MAGVGAGVSRGWIGDLTAGWLSLFVSLGLGQETDFFLNSSEVPRFDTVHLKFSALCQLICANSLSTLKEINFTWLKISTYPMSVDLAA